MPSRIITEPSKEPVSLLEVKEHLKVEVADDDGLIIGLIRAARIYCETFQSKSYITRTVELWLDKWPDDDELELPGPPLLETVVTGGSFSIGTRYRILSVGNTNFVAIGAASNTVGVVFTATGAGSGSGTATASVIVDYYDITNTLTTLPGSYYYVDTVSKPGRLGLTYGYQWPATQLRDINGICVTFLAGYGLTVASIPQNVKQAILMLVAHWYKNREAAGVKDDPEIPFSVSALLWQERCK